MPDTMCASNMEAKWRPLADQILVEKPSNYQLPRAVEGIVFIFR